MLTKIADALAQAGQLRAQLPLSFFNILSLSEHNREKGETHEHRELGRWHHHRLRRLRQWTDSHLHRRRKSAPRH
jgi:hypothetical protein